MSLDQISPLTFSIGNTMKRISVIVSSIIIFHTPVQPVNALGAAIAILGTFLYSQVNSYPFDLSLTAQNSLIIIIVFFWVRGPKCLVINADNLLSVGIISMPFVLWQQKGKRKTKNENAEQWAIVEVQINYLSWQPFFPCYLGECEFCKHLVLRGIDSIIQLIQGRKISIQFTFFYLFNLIKKNLSSPIM